MIITQEKANAFLESINSDAEAQCLKIRQEADRYVSSELEKARQRARETTKSLRKSEYDRLNEQTNAGFSELEARETRKLLERRAEITDEVFGKAEKKLVEFVNSEKYIEFLKRSIQGIKTALGEDSVIILRPDDKKYEAELLTLCKEIKYDPTIRIGGCRAENPARRIIADDTLEVRMNAEKDRFYKTSGLCITK